MEMKFLLATRNSAKLKELREILSDLRVDCVSPDEAGYAEDVEEDGETFFENAMKKAKAACAATGIPIAIKEPWRRRRRRYILSPRQIRICMRLNS